MSDPQFLAASALDTERNAHLASSLSALGLLLECSIDRLRLLADNLGLIGGNDTGGQYNTRATVANKQTFSIANSSSALTLISRAFSSASCLMKATYERTRAEGDACRLQNGAYTILFISESTSSSFIGRDIVAGGQRLQRSDVEGGKRRSSFLGTPKHTTAFQNHMSWNICNRVFIRE